MALERVGHPVLHFVRDHAADLGAEFVRWEVACVVAAQGLGVNPLDQPAVMEVKERTEELLAGAILKRYLYNFGQYVIGRKRQVGKPIETGEAVAALGTAISVAFAPGRFPVLDATSSACCSTSHGHLARLGFGLGNPLNMWPI